MRLPIPPRPHFVDFNNGEVFGYAIAAGVFGILGLVALIVFVSDPWSIKILVPEYYALEDLLKIVKK